MDNTSKALFNKALQWLSRREYSETELKQKLLNSFPEAASEIDDLLLELKQRNYLNNDRFIASRIRHRLSQGYGSERILLELIQIHHFSRQEIMPILEAEQAERLDSPLTTLIAKKVDTLDLNDFKARQKLIAYCLRRGFRLPDIQAALHTVNAQSDSAFPD